MNRKVFLVLSIVCVLLIWAQSVMPGEVSSQESGWVTEEVVNPLLRRVTGRTVTEQFVRKCAHVLEFLIFSIFLFLAFERNVLLTLLMGWLVAFLDETIQLLTQRGPMIQDVWIDLCGVVTGMAITWLIGKLCRRKWTKKRET